MLCWLHITLISAFSLLLIILLLILIRKKCSKPTIPAEISTTDAEECDKPPQEIIPHQNQSSRPRKSFFSWSDHPSLLAHAVENGWPRFSFTPSPSLDRKESNVVISWEVFEESSDYMQKVRLISGVSGLTVIRTALPLPGPQFGDKPFPQEAYFEVTILPNEDEEVKMGGDEDEIVLMGVGLTGGSHLPWKFPGSFAGSVGFNCNGSVYLDGMELVGGSEKKEWGRAGNVMGCGLNPAHKKVFFTLNSELTNEIRCKTEAFGHPLYPTLAANSDVTFAVNLGQSPFKFEAANAHRNPNPCFLTTHANASASAPQYELDSKELFSIGTIDGKWKQWPRGTDTIHVHTSDRLSQHDLFDIAVK